MWSAAKWRACREWARFIVEVLALVGLGFYACTTHRLWRVADQQLRSSHRPWIEPRLTIAKPLTFDGDHATVVLAITVKNGGTSAAIHTAPLLSLVINGVATGDNPVLTQQNIWCRHVEGYLEGLARTGSAGSLVLPGSETTYPLWGVQSGRPDWRLSPAGDAFASVTGCIAYMDEFGSSHATLFTLLLMTSAFKPSGVITGPWG